jgi:hypothetical protein
VTGLGAVLAAAFSAKAQSAAKTTRAGILDQGIPHLFNQQRVMFRRALVHAVLAVVVIVAAAGCSSANQLATSSTSPTSERECGRTPGTAATWRPQLGYCEY